MSVCRSVCRSVNNLEISCGCMVSSSSYVRFTIWDFLYERKNKKIVPFRNYSATHNFLNNHLNQPQRSVSTWQRWQEVSVQVQPLVDNSISCYVRMPHLIATERKMIILRLTWNRYGYKNISCTYKGQLGKAWKNSWIFTKVHDPPPLLPN